MYRERYIHIYIYVYKYMYTYICMYTYIYTCMYREIWSQSLIFHSSSLFSVAEWDQNCIRNSMYTYIYTCMYREIGSQSLIFHSSSLFSVAEWDQNCIRNSDGRNLVILRSFVSWVPFHYHTKSKYKGIFFIRNVRVFRNVRIFLKWMRLVPLHYPPTNTTL